jgi:hypothetical protein
MMLILVNFSICELLDLADAEFLIILVSCPVKTTMPNTQSVFLKEEPLSSKLSAPREIFPSIL